MRWVRFPKRTHRDTTIWVFLKGFGCRDNYIAASRPTRLIEAQLQRWGWLRHDSVMKRIFLHPASHPVDDHDLSLIRPIFGLCNQTRTHWILVHIIPFLGVAFQIANEVVEESALPKFGFAT